VHVKAVVAEQVRESGTLVLNADDPNVLGLIDRPRMRAGEHTVVLVSTSPTHPAVVGHARTGGWTDVVDHRCLVERRGTSEAGVLPVDEVPGALGGAAVHQLTNALLAIAAARAIGVPLTVVASDLPRFAPYANPGRGSLFALRGGHVLVDYGRNPEAISAVAQVTRALWGTRVHALLTLPGDRCDALLRDAARAAARGFPRLTVHEDRDLRGRAPGEVPALVYAAVRATAPHVACRVERDTVTGLRDALAELQPGHVVVVFYDRLGDVLDVLTEAGAVPVEVPSLVTPPIGVAWSSSAVRTLGAFPAGAAVLHPGGSALDAVEVIGHDAPRRLRAVRAGCGAPDAGRAPRSDRRGRPTASNGCSW
jgi:cyanophycin synthetase